MDNTIRITVDLYFKASPDQMKNLDIVYNKCLEEKESLIEQISEGTGADLVDIIEVEKVGL